MSCGAENEALQLLETLTAGVSFDIPTIDLDDPIFDIPVDSGINDKIEPITVEQLTAGVVDGGGVFDKLMTSIKAHLKEEYEMGRITGAEYTKAYTGLVTAAMGNATQFLLNRDTAYWQALTAQVSAITGRIGIASAKVALARTQLDALGSKATYALTTLRLSNESVQYCISDYNLQNTLPKQLEVIQEQYETQRAQTLDQRSDGSAVAGSLGKQKELYSQQITSYQRDAEVKAAKVFTDIWVTTKTIDDGWSVPTDFANTIDEVLNKIQTNNGLQ